MREESSRRKFRRTEKGDNKRQHRVYCFVLHCIMYVYIYILYNPPFKYKTRFSISKASLKLGPSPLSKKLHNFFKFSVSS